MNQIKETLENEFKKPNTENQKHAKVLIELSELKSEQMQLEKEYYDLEIRYEELQSKYDNRVSDVSKQQEKSVRFK